MFQYNFSVNFLSSTVMKTTNSAAIFQSRGIVRYRNHVMRILKDPNIITNPLCKHCWCKRNVTLISTALINTRSIYVENAKTRSISNKPNFEQLSKTKINAQLCRRIQTSQKRQSSGLFVKFLKPITRLFAIILGIKFRRWWLSLSPSQKAEFITSLKRNTATILFAFSCLYGCMCLFYVTHLYTSPITNRQQFIMFSNEQIKHITDLEQSYIIERSKEYLLSPNSTQYKGVSKIVGNIIKSNQDITNVRNKSWSLYVINQPDIKNAFALSNGSIFIFTGLLTLIENENQLGVVISHEIAHAILSHREEQISNGNFGQLLLIVPIILLWASLPLGWALISNWIADYFTALLIQLPFSRSLEAEADRIGLFMAAKACVDVREAAVFWNKLSILSSVNIVPYEPIEFFSTHPSYETRRKLIEENLPAALSLRSRSSCPPLPGQE